MVIMGASLAASAASTVASIQAQKANAAAQEIQQQQLTEANNNVVYQQQADIRTQQAQQAEQQAREGEKARLTNQSAKSTATVAAGEAGVQGASVGALLDEYDMNLGQFREASIRQAQLNDIGAGQQIAALQQGGRYQNLQINRPVAQPQYGAAALNLASSAFGTLNTAGVFSPRASSPTAIAPAPSYYVSRIGPGYSTKLPTYGT
jgi:hypothetical protein